MTTTVIRGDAANLPLPDNSVNLIVTSPPYFALRSYKDGGEHYEGQIGDEATPAEFVAALIRCTREWVRVLKPSGSLWVNLGDKYNAYNGNRGRGTMQDNGPRQNLPSGHGLDVKDIRAKSLIGVPWRYALACIDDLGLILRAEVIWAKPNVLPESVTDRVRRSHETWFHFTLEPRYFSSVDAVREPHIVGGGKTWQERKDEGVSWTPGIGTRGTHLRNGQVPNSHMSASPLGKLPGSVWTIPTQPLTVPDHLGVDHFAAFPMEWPRRIIRGWAPTRGICQVCGEGLQPVTEVRRAGDCTERRDSDRRFMGAAQGQNRNPGQFTITGYACACDTTGPTTPAVVLDPFGGTGTTALIASVEGCHGITVDLSHDYCRLAQWRTTDPGERARAMQVAKPAPVHESQGVLL